MNGYSRMLKFRGLDDEANDHYARTLYNLVAGMGARTVLEIGGGPQGVSGTAFCFALAEVAREKEGPHPSLTTVDIEPQHPPYSLRAAVTEETGIDWWHSPGDSLQPQLPFIPGVVDLLYIDGEHGYEHAMGDYMRFEPLVRKHGLIVFDDWPVSTGVSAAVERLNAQGLWGVPLMHSPQFGNCHYVFRKEERSKT